MEKENNYAGYHFLLFIHHVTNTSLPGVVKIGKNLSRTFFEHEELFFQSHTKHTHANDLYYLTLSQTTNFRLFKIQRVCRRQI